MTSIPEMSIFSASTSAPNHVRAEMHILLDSVISHSAVAGNRCVCCTGARIAVIDVLPALAYRGFVPLPPGGELQRLDFSGEQLFTLLQDGNILSRSVDRDEEWGVLSLACDDIRDIAVTEQYLFVLTRSRVVVKLHSSHLTENEHLIDVPARARHLRSIPPYIVAFGASVVWIGVVEAEGVQQVYLSEAHPMPVCIWGQRGEIFIADQVDGLTRLIETEDGILEVGERYTEVPHPYFGAQYGDSSVIITERGPMRLSSGEISSLDLHVDAVMALHTVDKDLLVAHPRQLSVWRHGEEVSVLTLPGYNYSVARSEDTIGCVTESSLSLFTSQGENIVVDSALLPGTPRIAALRLPHIYVATTKGLFALNKGHASSISHVSQLDGEGEPVSLVLNPSGTQAFWSCGRYLRRVDIEPNGILHLAEERVLGVYPFVLALGGDYLYAACGDGGLLWGLSSNLEKLARAPELTFVTDVATDGERVVAVTSKTLAVFTSSPGGLLSLMWHLDNQQDLCSCAFDGELVVFAAGKRLNWATLKPGGSIEILHSLYIPFAPRRIHLFNGCVYVTGSGGTLIVAPELSNSCDDKERE